ncbi:MAG TPA: alpha/beta hydrolase fold domain-containing protein [Pirellulales bacterium]|jgi:acetyl esterase/lipase|nr:alpha/beta hydrolase fold domain-containing protein [Pirellulales bacterium]
MTHQLSFVTKALFASLLLCTPVFAQEPGGQFKLWDKDQDGKLTRDELPEFLRPLFDQIDTNKDGSISPEENQQFIRRRNQNQPLRGPRIPDTIKAELDIPYAATDNPRQRLDLFLPKSPKSDKPLPVVAFIHGGGWKGGDKRAVFGAVIPLVESGEYAGVSIGYRLTGEAIWPAQIYDCKAAVRWLRANAKKYNFDPDRIGVTGGSAGGHLVAMLGTSGGISALEGNLGENTGISSNVACVVDQFGPADLLTMGERYNRAESPVGKLIGGPVPENKDKARDASPTTFVSSDDPPFLMIHGTNDQVVPFSQSEELLAALRKAGVEAVLIPVEGGGHGNFGTPETSERMRLFFDKHLLGKEVSISPQPITAGPPTRPKG